MSLEKQQIWQDGFLAGVREVENLLESEQLIAAKSNEESAKLSIDIISKLLEKVSKFSKLK